MRGEFGFDLGSFFTSLDFSEIDGEGEAWSAGEVVDDGEGDGDCAGDSF
jgi:hypothetical protein